MGVEAKLVNFVQRWGFEAHASDCVEVKSSHVPMLSKPDVVIEIIRKATKAIQENTAT